MINLYVTTSCTSCRKARAWLEENNLPYTEKNIVANPLSIEELKAILRLTEEGTEEIISYRSHAYIKLSKEVDINDLSLEELLGLIHKNPELIRRPILIDEKRIQVGYNADEIRCFLPREVRNVGFREIQQQLYLGAQ
ncbi:transcriptional regulator SpxA [Pisciglobus halotolerans]|uniref:Regulatory protein spx n=1 Tax=Pisciglobus halotolerans TaxID=745365 RepID=A0A1I3DIC0_9LACT|nr:transcriptional regulator SpxA [Pisciglobus halotolerans]SFH86475.1 regulatory protein spx [Pisciglobus halotolerans]